MNTIQKFKDDLLAKGVFIGELSDFISQEEMDKLKITYSDVSRIAKEELDKYFTYRHNYQPPNDEPQTYNHKPTVFEIIERDKFCKENNLLVWQRWLESAVPPGGIEITNNPFEISLGVIKKFYPEFSEKFDNSISKGNISLFQDGDFICNHRDGKNEGRICGILIYLTPESEYKDGGGELILKTADDQSVSITPTFGRFCILDFTIHNIEHEVNPVKNGFERFTYINFITIRDKDFKGLDLNKII
jgi:Rps23 Pro-64 3,4-dihydroxylase Tpa1-like proline 4-hydroxylase